jgi:hypothetical protein
VITETVRSGSEASWTACSRSGAVARPAASSRVLAIRDSGAAPCGHLAELIDAYFAHVERRLTELAQARTVLRQLQERAAMTGVCTILVGGLPSGEVGR